jgi:hypothetical protein
MLNNLSEQIRDCLQHAEDCARKAAAQPDGSQLRQDFLDMERRWLVLVQSYDLTQRLGDFSGEAKRRASNLYSDGQRTAVITPFLQGQAFDPETVEAMGKAFVTTCETLGLSDRTDAMTKLIAKKIIEMAQRGHKNPTALHLAAIKEFKSDPQ